ncbi:hypothetical protein H3018_gp29 [Bacillus phage DK3]|uniref:Uncharacterized protein n=3 Tax=Hemphillvirus TaxID=2842725 RepID=A0A3T0IIZ7_9CAUD|nr:hypothetical protein H3016_gp29 [Bacillus phage DK1]YP_009910472.1 hypothetical protein H3017_gp27 [Bacillus phage DK2]YP_009910519.1 hypothetical protein H3018_gp29 [Bacillus phage DK3]AZU99733.1 hypothetical protein DK1_000029 [Bacillus phage DK1]AZU99780.1 hypothetical protein DK2_000027 [Bacillus phage DK2]AZU99827.1 hypothetical protein DK3_000029 [Bacillus phage DK3]
MKEIIYLDGKLDYEIDDRKDFDVTVDGEIVNDILLELVNKNYKEIKIKIEVEK